MLRVVRCVTCIPNNSTPCVISYSNVVMTFKTQRSHIYGSPVLCRGWLQHMHGLYNIYHTWRITLASDGPRDWAYIYIGLEFGHHCASRWLAPNSAKPSTGTVLTIKSRQVFFQVFQSMMSYNFCSPDYVCNGWQDLTKSHSTATIEV